MVDFPNGVKIRPSMTSGYSDCPLRAIVRAFPEMFTAIGYTPNPIGTSIATSVGTGVHGGAAATLIPIIDTGRMGSEDDATESAISAFRDALTESAEVFPDDVTPNVDTAEKQVRRMLRAFRQQVAPLITPIRVETRLEADAGDGFYLSGQSDWAAIDPHGIDDLKTGAIDRVHMAQLGAYSLICRGHGHHVARLRQFFIPRERLTKPDPVAQPCEYPVDVAEVVAESTIARIKADVTSLAETGDPMTIMANPSSMLCSAKWCGAFGTPICRRHKGAK